jgi:hypothetical protein
VLLQALHDASTLVRWPLHGFSTEVHPVSAGQLARGQFRTTHGTDIACVARHLLDNRVRRAVVITDGQVQSIPPALAERLARSRPSVHVGLLDGCDAGFRDGLRWPVTRLPPLDRDG